MNSDIYLDYAAATPVDEKVIEAAMPYLSDKFYNPSSVYLASRAIKDDLLAARQEIAHWLGTRSSEIIFSAGATEANNIAIYGVMSQSSDSNIVVSSVEHESVIAPASNFECRVVGVDSSGRVKLTELISKIDEKTRLVSVIYANNEIGTVQHLMEISKIIKSEIGSRLDKGIKTPLYLHTDASQAANFLDLHVNKLGVDMMTINGAKIYGFKQSGALYVRAGIKLNSYIFGGGQERSLRSGTENTASAIGLAKALHLAQVMRKQEVKRLTKLNSSMMEGLDRSIDDIEFLGHKKHRIPSIVSVIVNGVDGERVVMMLDEAGIKAATGSACSANKAGASSVVKALGKSENQANSTLRFSMGKHSTLDDVEKLIEVLPEIVSKERNLYN